MEKCAKVASRSRVDGIEVSDGRRDLTALIVF